MRKPGGKGDPGQSQKEPTKMSQPSISSHDGTDNSETTPPKRPAMPDRPFGAASDGFDHSGTAGHSLDICGIGHLPGRCRKCGHHVKTQKHRQGCDGTDADTPKSGEWKRWLS